MRLEPLWWQLPGPKSFLQTVVADILGGRNVVLAFSKFAPGGLRRAIAEHFLATDECFFRGLDCVAEHDQPNKRPAAHIHQYLSPLERAGEFPTAATVARAERLRETVVWLDGLTELNWPDWRRFLEEYKDACRCLEDVTWPRFVAPLEGLPAAELPPNDVNLAVYRWCGHVDRTDMLLYASNHLNDRGTRGVARELKLAIVVELAGTDPVLADWLVEQPLAELLQPESSLRLFAQRRGWAATPCIAKRSGNGETHTHWVEGMWDERDGRPLPHAAASVLDGRREDIERRLWRVQVGVLFPVLEEVRHQLVNRHRMRLHVPVVTEWEVIENPDSLEFSHLRHQLRPLVSGRQLRDIECCLRIRNALAHLRPAAPEDVVRLVELTR